MERFVSAQPYTLLVKNSRFLAEMFPIASPEEARSVIAEQRNRFADIRHVVHAFVCGPTGGILGCSDDGEPSGTAGRPVLEVLKNSGFTDVILTVLRWFGGTKLGTGGLVHAYSDSAKGVLTTAQGKLIRDMRNFTFTVPFSQAESVRRMLAETDFTIDASQYGANGLTITGELPAENASSLNQRMADLTRGAILLIPPPGKEG